MRKTLEGFRVDLSQEGGKAPAAVPQVPDQPLPLKKVMSATRDLQGATALQAVAAAATAGPAAPGIPDADVFNKAADDFTAFISGARKAGAKISSINIMAMLDLMFGLVPNWGITTETGPYIQLAVIERLGLRKCFANCRDEERGFFVQLYWWQKHFAEKGLKDAQMRAEFLRILGKLRT
jgi:hypothetical protein